MTETTSSTTPFRTWRDTDTYRWLMAHSDGDEQLVEELRDIFNRPEPLVLNCPVEFVQHVATYGNPGHGVVAALATDRHQYPPRIFYGDLPGDATRKLTAKFAKGHIDWDWRVVFSLDNASAEDIEALHAATRSHWRSVAIIAHMPPRPILSLSASPALADAALPLSTRMEFETADEIFNRESFFFPPNRPARS